MNINRYAKAVVGALLAGLGALQTALIDGNVAPNEWITVTIATVAALGIIWGVPNSAAEPEIQVVNAERPTKE